MADGGPVGDEQASDVSLKLLLCIDGFMFVVKKKLPFDSLC